MGPRLACFVRPKALALRTIIGIAPWTEGEDTALGSSRANLASHILRSSDIDLIAADNYSPELARGFQ